MISIAHLLQTGWRCRIPRSRLMHRALRITVLGSCLALAAGCASDAPNTFTFTADLPPGFVYEALAEYIPAKGETCSVPGGRNTKVRYNSKWREHYEPISEIAIRRTVKGCPLIIWRVSLEIYATFGQGRGDFSADNAGIILSERIDEQYKGVFDKRGESIFYGECQWLFRTVGKQRRIIKILKCQETNEHGTPAPGGPFAAYTYDQLPGNTVKMAIKLSKQERPGWGDTWIRVPNGWKRCLGKGAEDQLAYCNGNHTDFSTFKMMDGRICTIYPGCTE